MPSAKGSYEEVESGATLFQSPHHEGDTVLHLASTLMTTPEPQESSPPKQYILGPLTHEASSSNSPLDFNTVTPDPLPSSSSTTGTFHPRSQRTTVSSIKSFASSPLKPIISSGPSSFSPSPFNRSASRASTHINRIASEESRALASSHQSHSTARGGSMILYRCADINIDDVLQPPAPSHLHRNSVLSTSGDSIVSLSSDSKYPTRTIGSERGLIAYAYDPSLDELCTALPAEDDYLHDPDEKKLQQLGSHPLVSIRGVYNAVSLIALISALLCLFVVYPVIRFYHDNTRNNLITFNARVNSTGQVPDPSDAVSRRSQEFFSSSIPFIDKSTPLHARVLRTSQDITYTLVFSDEFTQPGRSFIGDNDPIWDTRIPSGHSQIDTEDGSLVVRFDAFQARRHGDRQGHRCGVDSRIPDLDWSGWEDGDRGNDRSGMERCILLKMKVPLCLRHGGFVEVGLGKREIGSGLRRRLIYWPDSSDTWASFNQTESPTIPSDILRLPRSVSKSGLSLLAFSIGVLPVESAWVGRAELDYVRIYQPVLSETGMDCAAVPNDVMLDLMEV